MSAESRAMEESDERWFRGVPPTDENAQYKCPRCEKWVYAGAHSCRNIEPAIQVPEELASLSVAPPQETRSEAQTTPSERMQRLILAFKRGVLSSNSIRATSFAAEEVAGRELNDAVASLESTVARLEKELEAANVIASAYARGNADLIDGILREERP